MAYDEFYHEYYVRDYKGCRIYVGDHVECLTFQYASIDQNERRRVQRIEGENIVLHNGYSPHGTSQYRPRNFRLAGRHHPYHARSQLNELQGEKMSKPVLYIAVQIGNAPYNEIAALINDNPSKLATFSDTSYDALQARLRQRILTYPTERWLILSGTTLAETSAPPVIFRTA